METRFVLSCCMLMLALLASAAAEMSEHRVVEVVAVLDAPIYTKWRGRPGINSHEDVVTQVKSFFFEVNVVYQSLRAFNQSIEIRLKDILFPNTTIPSKVKNGNNVDKDKTLSDFRKWVSKNIKKSYDHAMYLTKFNLVGANGVAYLDTACSGSWAVSEVKMQWGYRVVKTMAHEIGHSLGAGHDSKKKKECKSKFIMYPGGETGSRNRWFFSPCAAKTFAKKVFKSGKKKCLLPNKTKTDPIVSARLGEVKESSCSGGRFLFEEGDKKCNVLKCLDGRKYTVTNTAEGTWCGDGKQCFGGHCVETSTK